MHIPKGKRLQDTVKQLEEKLANSVPKTELETVRSILESKIAEHERRLCESAPKTTLEAARKDLQAKITDLETKLRDSIPRSEGEASQAKLKESSIEHTSEFCYTRNVSSREVRKESRIRQLVEVCFGWRRGNRD